MGQVSLACSGLAARTELFAMAVHLSTEIHCECSADTSLLVSSNPRLCSCVPAWFLGIHRRACLRQHCQPFHQDALHAAPPLGARNRNQTLLPENKPFCHLRHHSPSRAVFSLDITQGAARVTDRMISKNPSIIPHCSAAQPHACTEPCSLLPHASIPEPESAFAGSIAALLQARPQQNLFSSCARAA